jgi:hypothetical protein
MPCDSKVNDNGVVSRCPATDSQPAAPPHQPDAGPRNSLSEKAPRRRRFLVRLLTIAVAIVVAWLMLAYLIFPVLWRHYEHQPALESAPKTTLTAQGIPGDPLNVGLIGTEEELVRALLGSGWDAADPVTLKSSIRIGWSVLRDRPYSDAPVSSLFVFGRKQDLAFEKPVGKNASHRHHVRFWKATEYGRDGLPLWIGAVTYDRSVGLSHRTGQITHHIAGDIDAERDGLFADLRKEGRLTEEFQVTGVGATLLGRNGGGDRYYTDGELTIGVFTTGQGRGGAADRLENPVPVQIKDQLWSAIRPLMQSLSGP